VNDDFAFVVKKEDMSLRYTTEAIEIMVESANVSPNKVLALLSQLRIKADSPDLIIEAVRKNGEWVAISREPLPASLEIEVTPDEMEAYATYYPAFKMPQLTPEEILKTLRENELEISIDNVAQLVLSNPFEKVIVAKGIEPIDGKDASLEWVYQQSICSEWDQENHIDFKEIITKWDYVKAGAVLVKKIPSQKGKAGKSVRGRILAAKDGRDIDLRKIAGKNIFITEDNLTIVAKIDGIVQKEGTRISVVSQLVVDSDVDFHTGNIENFIEAVQINGTVREGFKVRAKTSIQVHGAVEGSYLEAGQNIKIDGIVAGNNKAQLVSGNAVIARQIVKSTVKAPLVIVETGIFFSQIQCGDLYVTHPKAKISGSTISAERYIVSPNVGNELAERVVLQITGPQCLEAEYKQLTQQMAETRAAYNELAETVKKAPSMSKLYEERMAVLSNQMFELDQNIKDILTKKQEALKKARIFVRDTVYPNVEIQFGASVYLVRSELTYVTFVFEGGQVKFYPYTAPPPIPRVIFSK
jgi:uncharacterized protein (DUF342 family)